MARPRITTSRIATRGNNQFIAGTSRGGRSFSATGRTARAATARLRRGFGASGG